MKKSFKQLTLAALGVLLSAAGAQACEQYKNLSTAEMKEYRDKLVEAGADPLDRLFAFEELSCSDNPTIRAYAIREGIAAAKDPLVREQIAFTSMMSKTRVDIELVIDSNASATDKKIVQGLSGLWSREARFKSPQHGCISFNSTDNCWTATSLFVKGDKIEMNFNDLLGEFHLTSDNVFAGFIRFDDRADNGRVPAVIKLH
ncbi:hypothetical protein [Nitratireductor pacificus]|uniref:Uncharacterized protein n=1 Tax=Nitratireductor pacificus pht-3B TaxID=391937 RepID=K2MN86_9HYPH|nr:hypothetical protein [Nitratireductor pacificus]EKF18732.1 hypothetical protein NA2_11130 [Nitratireductor pacificus pht-3B]